MTLDHFHPLSEGGVTELANIVYSCPNCNQFKGAYWQPASTQRILHPKIDRMELHITQNSACELVPLTETGKFHISALKLNRPALVEHRKQKLLIESNRIIMLSTLDRITYLENHIESLESEIY